jgi:hypothetical protein
MNSISDCDEHRLHIAAEAERNWAEGRKFAAAGKHKKALECLLFAFDNGRYVEGWGGVRLSFIPAAIARLGAEYPPALGALRERRDAREQLIRDGLTDYDIVSEWISINRYLGENERMLNLVNEVSPKLRTQIIQENFDNLLASRQYTLAAEVLNTVGQMFFTWEFHYETGKYFPRRSTHESSLESNRRTLRARGLQVFELALAVKRRAEAAEVARRLLLHCGEAETYIDLINAANNVNSKVAVRQLLKKAKSNLSAEDFARVNDAAASSDT